MPTCASCSAELRPEWRFCIHCGARTIPGAIRPEVAAIAATASNRLATIAQLTVAALSLVVGAVIIVLVVANAIR